MGFLRCDPVVCLGSILDELPDPDFDLVSDGPGLAQNFIPAASEAGQVFERPGNAFDHTGEDKTVFGGFFVADGNNGIIAMIFIFILQYCD